MSKIREEIRRRFPRLVISLVIAVIFFAIGLVVPQTVSNINIPSLNADAGSVVQIITTIITVIFLIRALSDALVIGDVVIDIIIRQMGIRGERSPKRAARDFIYIIIIILAATALLPIINVYLEGDVGFWLTTLTIYSALGIILILIYDVGRILYRIIEQRAESLADRLSKIAEQNENGE
jgi:cation transport ATPase